MLKIVYIIYMTGCREGWQSFSKSCYYKPNGKRCYSEALESCRKFNATLVNINSEEENDFVYDTFVSKPTYSETFIGVVRENPDGTKFVTSDGKPQTYFKWALPEPNDKHGLKDCVEMGHRTWNDIVCENKRRFVCESSKYV